MHSLFGNKFWKPCAKTIGYRYTRIKTNEVIYFDFCFIGKSSSGPSYVLIIKDDFSSYVWLYPCESVDAETGADALIDLCAAFGIIKQWISDQGSHFKNEIVSMLRKDCAVRITSHTHIAPGQIEQSK